jgi:hypothetical protein
MEQPMEQPTERVVLVASPELLRELLDDWSPPVRVRVYRTPGIGTGWEMEARAVETDTWSKET